MKTFPELMPPEGEALRPSRTPSKLEQAARDHNWRLGRIAALRAQAERVIFDVMGARSTSLYRVVEGLCKLLSRRVESDFERVKGMELSLRASVSHTQGDVSPH